MVSIRSLQGLFKELEAEGYKYLLAAKCNQDVLESYFSLIRGFGKFYDHPLPTAVTHRIKYLLCSKSACDILRTGNCIAEQCETLSVDVLKKIDLAESVQDCETSDLIEAKLGLRVLVCPEGKRHGGDELLPFKKGAFHMAIAAQVPIVPVVIQKYKFLDHDKCRFDSGQVLMSILQPISTIGLKKEDVSNLSEKAYGLMMNEYKTLNATD